MANITFLNSKGLYYGPDPEIDNFNIIQPFYTSGGNNATYPTYLKEELFLQDGTTEDIFKGAFNLKNSFFYVHTRSYLKTKNNINNMPLWASETITIDKFKYKGSSLTLVDSRSAPVPLPYSNPNQPFKYAYKNIDSGSRTFYIHLINNNEHPKIYANSSKEVSNSEKPIIDGFKSIFLILTSGGQSGTSGEGGFMWGNGNAGSGGAGGNTICLFIDMNRKRYLKTLKVELGGSHTDVILRDSDDDEILTVFKAGKTDNGHIFKKTSYWSRYYSDAINILGEIPGKGINTNFGDNEVFPIKLYKNNVKIKKGTHGIISDSGKGDKNKTTGSNGGASAMSPDCRFRRRRRLIWRMGSKN